MVTLGFSKEESQRAIEATHTTTEKEIYSKAQPWSLERRVSANKAEYAAEREIHTFDHMDMDGYALRWGNDASVISSSLDECGRKCRDFKPEKPYYSKRLSGRTRDRGSPAAALLLTSKCDCSVQCRATCLSTARSSCALRRRSWYPQRPDNAGCRISSSEQAAFDSLIRKPPGSRKGWCWLKNQPLGTGPVAAPQVNMNGTDKRTQTGFVEWQAGVVVRTGTRVRTDSKSARANW
jgi:hypothetical protein